MILFYGRGPYWPFSNFYPAGFSTEGKWYPTSEHYFQSMKFAGNSELMEKVRCKGTPTEAAIMGRDRSLPLRPDWEEVKDDVMFEALSHKFNGVSSVSSDIIRLLVSTGNEEIIEDSPNDFYWGWGRDHSGKNMLGKLLMRLRRIDKVNTRHTERIPLEGNVGLYSFPRFVGLYEELHGKDNIASDWETMEVIVIKEQSWD